MLSDKMEKALNEQLNAELYSSYLYLSMASHFKKIGLPGFARWMEVQSLEELTHAMKFFDYVGDRGQQAILSPVPGPPSTWVSPLAAFENAFQHEVKVSGLINALVNLAMEQKDHATNNFLQWFVAEQVEEEASTDAIVQKLKLIRDSHGGLFMLDRELGQRTFTVPPGTTVLGGKAP